MDPVRAVGTEHDGLLDVAGARGAGHQVGCPREYAALAAGERETILVVADDPLGHHDGDMGLGQQVHRGRGVRPGQHHQRPGLGHRDEGAADADHVLPVRTARLDLEAGAGPVEIAQRVPADGTLGQPVRIEVAGDGPRHLGEPVDPLGGAGHARGLTLEVRDAIGVDGRLRADLAARDPVVDRATLVCGGRALSALSAADAREDALAGGGGVEVCHGVVLVTA